MQMFNGMFGKVANGMCRLSMNGGIAVKTSDGYKTYNVKTNKLTNCSNFVFDIGEEFFFVIPTNKVEKGDIMVAGFNFGCGSSREHAPIAIKASGISLVIAKTFARIFYRNAINIGLAILECPEASAKIADGDDVEVDFDTGVITNHTKGEEYKAQPFPPFIQEIITKGGLLASLSME